jgi:SAM-dependent methyltransferase
MSGIHAPMLSEIAKYYSDRLTEHGESPRGVDWNGEHGQTLRFAQLCKIVDSSTPFSLNDLGCGYGALCDFLAQRYIAFSYAGIDISEKMIEAASRLHSEKPGLRFVCASEPDQLADYGVASGIFNVRLGKPDAEWKAYMVDSLDKLDRTSTKGFAFNCLTSYSDADRIRDYLYYADPCEIFDLCKRRYSRNVALLHDYDLYEFTILVSKKS